MGIMFFYEWLWQLVEDGRRLTTDNVVLISMAWVFNTLKPAQNGWHFADHSFICIFVNENFRILDKISQRYVPEGLIESKPLLVQIMGCRRTGDKLLSEPMMV